MASKRGLLITLGIMMLRLMADAQDTAKRFKAFPFPVVYYAPETRFVGGVAGVATFRFNRDPIDSRPSSITTGVAYTQNRQLLLYATFSLFYNREKYYAFGEAGYYKYSYKFFGLGQHEVSESLYGVDYPRIKLNVTRAICHHFYAGFGYEFEDYKIKDTATTGGLAGNDIPGAHGSRSSGIGPQFVYDSRDTVLYPSHGFYGTAGLLNNGSTWGGDHNFNRYTFELSWYHPLHQKIILALNSYNSFVTGDAPFQQQSLLGGNKHLRGYYEGRYIDKNLMVLQAELRFPVYRRFGGVVFGGTGALGNEAAFIRTNDLKAAYGAGLRFNVVRKDHLNLRLDYALGPNTSGFYFTVGEAF